MKNRIKESDFNFEYTGGNSTEKEIIEKGFLQLSGKKLHSKITNKTVFGEYPGGYKFVSDIYENGIVNGLNNADTQDFGIWEIDFEKHTLHLEWKNNWFDTITHAYYINGNIEFYDVDSGNWRTTFKIFQKLVERE